MRYVADVFWLRRPPYLRWLAAAAIVSVAVLIEFGGRGTEPYPFVAAPIASGAAVVDALEWNEVPAGLLPDPGDPDGRAARALAAGEPLTATATNATAPIPAGWWSVPVPLPPTAQAGASVRLVSPEEGIDVEGVVTTPSESGAFATTADGLVAVPPDAAAGVARAIGRSSLVVLVGT